MYVYCVYQLTYSFFLGSGLKIYQFLCTIINFQAFDIRSSQSLFVQVINNSELMYKAETHLCEKKNSTGIFRKILKYNEYSNFFCYCAEGIINQLSIAQYLLPTVDNICL
jgi:hypothetical protein